MKFTEGQQDVVSLFEKFAGQLASKLYRNNAPRTIPTAAPRTWNDAIFYAAVFWPTN
ncbi:MAG: hypothetical protein FWH27_15045 [Planctomycetaceae bacterium]|nr:hypothetical protein [Planctomycetaceae bacterium]